MWAEGVGGWLVHVCEHKYMYCMSVDLYMHVRIPVKKLDTHSWCMQYADIGTYCICVYVCSVCHHK